MSDNATKYEVLIQQYLHLILDISAEPRKYITTVNTPRAEK